MKIYCALALSLVLLMVSVTPVASLRAKPAEQVLFDDFSYTDKNQLKKNGWIVRTVPGWPGVPGATWSEEAVSILKDPNQPNNLILRMTSATEGPGASTTQAQICHQRKYFEGTYAARVRFTDAPVSGPGGDQIVQSFYTISPLKAPMDLDYSELDYEYLRNAAGGSEVQRSMQRRGRHSVRNRTGRKTMFSRPPTAARPDGIHWLRRLWIRRSGILSTANYLPS